MKKSEKAIVMIFTVLILFAIVRFFGFEKEKKEDEGLEKKIPISKKNKETKSSSPSVLKVEKKDFKSTKERKKTPVVVKNSVPKNPFNQQTDHVFFKIQDGLALVGGDVILGELSEEHDPEDFKDKLLSDKPKKTRLWESDKIAFGFAQDYPESLKSIALEAINYFNIETAVKFFQVDIELDKDAIVFTYRKKGPCSSYLGKIGGYQPVYLNENCTFQNVLHEIMHALGFVHEQQREERDQVLEILWSNIEEEFKFNFSLLPDTMIHQYTGTVFNVSLNSVMIYKDTDFALPGKKAMKSLSGEKISPQADGLAQIDKERLKYLYGK